MDYTTLHQTPDSEPETSADQREAPRYTSLIRAAKLVSSQGEFVCVIRDVSSLGIGLRMFHEIPVGDEAALELGNGKVFELRRVRAKGREASFTFANPVPVDLLIREQWEYPRRQLRLNIAMPLTVTSISGRVDAITENLSQQGCRLECDAAFAIDQNLRIASAYFPEIRAKVRWRKDASYGLVFENTFGLQEFAQLVAALQCPQLLAE